MEEATRDDGAHRAGRPRWERKTLFAVAAALTAAGLFGTGWAARQRESTAHARNRPSLSGTPSADECGRTCRAAYDAIAEALPHEHGQLLVRTILATPGFDYLQLTKSLHIPTQAQLHAQWRRICLRRFPANTQAAAACIHMIDSWTPIPLPAPDSRAAS